MNRVIPTSGPFWADRVHGRCPECSRTDLPLVRIDWRDPAELPRCLDCCYGPPLEYWGKCDACGYWQPPQEVCDMCGEPMR